MAAETMTVGDVVARTTEFFRGRGIEPARLDAELLLGEALGMNRLQIYLNFDRPVGAAELERARELVRRRARHEPVAYILGRREFLSRQFAVSPAVLIPRPETELLVEAALEELRGRFPGSDGLRVLEFGVGSGAVSVSVLAEEPRARVVATEISTAAAEVARANAERHGVADRLDIRVQDDFAGIAGPFHALLANPPYVDPAELGSMSPDVVRFEPHEALFAADCGFAAIARVAAGAPGLLGPGGFVLMEVGAGQAARAAEIAAASGLRVGRIVRDYAGFDRHLLLEA